MQWTWTDSQKIGKRAIVWLLCFLGLDWDFDSESNEPVNVDSLETGSETSDANTFRRHTFSGGDIKVEIHLVRLGGWPWIATTARVTTKDATRDYRFHHRRNLSCLGIREMDRFTSTELWNLWASIEPLPLLTRLRMLLGRIARCFRAQRHGLTRVCPTCKGKGYQPSSGELHPCPTCNRTGRVTVR